MRRLFGPSSLGWADRRLAGVEDIFNLTAGVAIFFLMVYGVAQIIGRQLLNAPMEGYIDIVEQAAAIYAFFGAAYCQRLGGHVRMDMLVTRLGGRWLWLVEALTTLAALAILGTLVVMSWKHFLRAYQLGYTTIDIALPLWPGKLAVPVAFGLWWLRLLVQLVGYVRLLLNAHAAPVGVPVSLDSKGKAEEEIEHALV